jgi:hypothetical protein
LGGIEEIEQELRINRTSWIEVFRFPLGVAVGGQMLLDLSLKVLFAGIHRLAWIDGALIYLF